MVHAHKVISPFLRGFELVCAAIVLGILAHYTYLVDRANDDADNRLIYSLVIGAISVFFSLIFLYPAWWTFYACPVDFALSICWYVAFGLMVNRTIHGGCNADWFWSDWSYYWAELWYTVSPGEVDRTIVVGDRGCGEWRANLGFSFMGGLAWLISALIGMYVLTTYPRRQVAYHQQPNVVVKRDEREMAEQAANTQA
ncbi:hypothetical protein BJY04DRAFT_217620 [Aspergillus karnatakaensis]|uniref:MARVEL domain-containing protein n=1 Tax=Aspergillus karnatakaensis TaxID=1810916 RepID=UPI003CCDC066